MQMINNLNNLKMKKNNMLRSGMLIAILLSGTFLFTSCNNEEAVNESEVLVKYLESTIDPVSWMPAIKTAQDVYGDNVLGKVYIIDLRSTEAYNSGHIANAVNVPAGEILTHLESADLSGKDYIAVVCYTGQTASWATCLLRMAGYNNAYTMKFGMSSWNAEFDSWTSNTSNQYYTDFVTTASDKGAEGDLPELNTGYDNGEEILTNRIEAVLAEGFGAAAISNGMVMSNPDDYYIVNYWPEDHYTDPGHIPGAVQYTPKATLTLDTDLKTLPTDKTIVVYCYTGQTSAFMAAYLCVLGYDAVSLKFGANGMIYDHMPASQWSEGAIMGYEYVSN